MTNVRHIAREVKCNRLIEEMDEKVKEILENSSEKYKPVTVNKLLELNYDVGDLLAIDNNELCQKSLKENKNDYLLNLTRDNVQLLINKLWDLPTERVEDALMAKLPPTKFTLPRSQPIPKPKPLTKWQEFAKQKGIQKKKKSKLTWDEQLSKWIPLYGYKRTTAEKEKDWVLEVPQNSDPMEDQFTKKKTGKGERVSKNELQRLRNIAKAKNVKVPRVGLINVDVSSAKDLQTAVTVARSSTANLGKFQDKLPKEKEARGVAVITPGAAKKRKMPMFSSADERNKTLEIVNSVLNKRPKINTDGIVSRKVGRTKKEKRPLKKLKSLKKEPKTSKMVQKKGKGKGKARKIGGSGRKRR